MDQIQHKFIQVDDGLKLHVAEIGSGPLVVLFFHGFPEICYSWRHKMIAVAKAGYRAIAPDYRAYGLSEPPPEPHPPSLARFCKRRPAAEFCSNRNNFFFPIFPLFLLLFSGRRRRWWWVGMGEEEEEKGKGIFFVYYFEVCRLKILISFLGFL
ncbi:unnamed protein product [Coffea canephora]|uniref:DH200=94 genomic scaffold, scaffold_6894 n=1 Tax=Coffea canephora TaxID=49390 RepID=A0A068VM79_COFCA|nr:unnamed protein product [Coffea canephora]